MCKTYDVFGVEIENGHALHYHGTSKENAELILRDGFREHTYFTPFLSTAIEQGGEYVFCILFEEQPTDKNNWQWITKAVVPKSKILWLKKFESEQLYFSEDVEKKLNKSWLREYYGNKYPFCKNCNGRGQIGGGNLFKGDEIQTCEVCQGYGVTGWYEEMMVGK